jgi:ligand-binding sensor domain-containing protein
MSHGLAQRDKAGNWHNYNLVTRGRPLTDRIRALALGPDGSLWVGTSGGLLRLNTSGPWQLYNAANTGGGLLNDDVSALVAGTDGSLWAATSQGLAWLDQDDHWHARDPDYAGPLNNPVQTLASGSKGTLWIGTLSDGLVHRDEAGNWQTYNEASTKGRLPSDEIGALALNPDGSLWVGTASGLALFDKDRNWQTYDRTNTRGGLFGLTACRTSTSFAARSNACAPKFIANAARSGSFNAPGCRPGLQKRCSIGC